MKEKVMGDIDYVLLHGDPRLKNFRLMDSPRVTIELMAAYLLFVKFVGPYLMNNRQSFELRKFLVIYNIAIAVLNAWIFIRWFGVWSKKYNKRCEYIDYSDNEDSMLVLKTFYFFYLSKFLETLDTVCFVLRKKYSQITFLHVFHHATVPVVVWYLLKYSGGGYIIFPPMVNSFVHVFMYSYYGLSAIGPSMQKYLWWKKYITLLQLIQFVIGIIYMAQMVVFPVEGCNMRMFPVLLMFSQPVIFFALFLPFYVKSYTNKKEEHIKTGAFNQDEHFRKNKWTYLHLSIL